MLKPTKMYSKRTKARRVREYVEQLNLEIDNGVSHKHEIATYDVHLDSNVNTNTNQDILVNLSSADNFSSDLESDTESESSSQASSSSTTSLAKIDLPFELKNWSISHNITQNALSDLLKILNQTSKDSNLPYDARTLLSTPRNTKCKTIAGGEYYYFGVKDNVVRSIDMGTRSFTYPYFKKLNLDIGSCELLTLTVNTDGIPLSRSSKRSFWPILGKLDQSKLGKPFVLAIYSGTGKPTNVSEFFQDFVSQMKVLSSNGFTHNDIRNILMISLINADAPARSFLKCSVPYNAYHGCEKCITKGEWSGRVIFSDQLSELRTDESFKIQQDSRNHAGFSPFLT